MRVKKITKTTQKARSIALTLLALLLITACNNNTIFSSHTPIPNKGWESYECKEFYINIPATDNYDIDLFISHSSAYQYSNLWLFVDHISPDSTLTNDTINIAIADPYGKWIGNGWGNLHQIETNIAHSQMLDSGTHIIKLNQAMRDYNLKGISNIGLSVTKSEE